MFSHAFDFAFEVVSNRKDGTDVTAEMLRAALIQRVRRLTRDELREACGCFDTAEVPDD
ncbi:MAG: hypothetical protein Q8L76_14655 [Cypionkella sp.]|uniref:hypothetical protein n=1 Tax=Cypionkella sp. TaxID=2811411 RepID=UPI00272FC8F3|nr:hypothetical protein [Cypionkella sp.]MDP1577974.1 hypothetical protein [Cypionkella sp.]MDP2049080.1 hypothetical protein [Cypionkella sp.]